MSRPEWFPDWSGEVAVLVGSGPSAVEPDLESARGSGRHVMVINNSCALAPWADVLFAGDMRWWQVYGDELTFEGLRVGTDPRLQTPDNRWDVRYVAVDKNADRILTEPGVVGWGGNSGFQAINLLVQFGVSRIVLVGFDMRIDRGLHWHGRHPLGMANPRGDHVSRWRRSIDAAFGTLCDLGVEVLNTSEGSTLVNYRKVSFEEAIRA